MLEIPFFFPSPHIHPSHHRIPRKHFTFHMYKILTMTIEQSLSGTETTVSSWLSIIQRFWPDHRSSDTEYNHSSTQEPSNNTEESEAISKTLASLLHEKISCFELIPSKKQGYSRIPNCRQLESWDCGEYHAIIETFTTTLPIAIELIFSTHIQASHAF
jgi:hypothetical protein